MAHTFGSLLPFIVSLCLLWTGGEGLRETRRGAHAGSSPQADAAHASHATPTHPDSASLTANAATAVADASPAQFRGTAGRTEKKRANAAPVLLRSVRTASRQNFDRVVFEFAGRKLPGYHIEYIDRPARQCGSGDDVSLRGDALLRVRLTPAQAHTEAGVATINNRERVLNLKLMKEMKATCDFEGEVEWVLGLAAPNRYRVIELSNPARLVVDVKHSIKK